MNLFQVLFFSICIGLGTLLSIAAYHIGGYWLGVPGFIIGYLILPLLAKLYDRHRKRLYPGEHNMPPCSCGSNEFKFKIDQQDRNYYRFCQKCGAKYKKNGHIIWLYENNEKRVYKRMVKFKGWQ